ncbi:MAG: metalloregulator ArsR/SmtB family transcription factor [Phycisphaerales bacterium]
MAPVVLPLHESLHESSASQQNWWPISTLTVPFAHTQEKRGISVPPSVNQTARKNEMTGCIRIGKYGKPASVLLDYYTVSCNCQGRSSPSGPTQAGDFMDTCKPKLPLPDRLLISSPEADRLGGLFKSLAHPTRLRLLHALIRAGELAVSDLADEVDMSAQAVSNQLQRLAETGVVGSRRNGLQVIYRIIDPCVPVLLERGWCHIDEFQPIEAPEAV